MADTQKTCSITRILIKFLADSAFTILEAEPFIPGSIWGSVNIMTMKDKIDLYCYIFLFDLCSVLHHMKFRGNLFSSPRQVFGLSDSNWVLISKTLSLAFNSLFIYCEKNQSGYHNKLKNQQIHQKISSYFFTYDIFKALWNLLAFINFLITTPL